ncbi:hypothetical protein ATKI12_6375 [Kitasatospora sp. Ki12]
MGGRHLADPHRRGRGGRPRSATTSPAGSWVGRPQSGRMSTSTSSSPCWSSMVTKSTVCGAADGRHHTR